MSLADKYSDTRTERALLGTLATNPSLIAEIDITPRDFSDSKNSIVCQALLELHAGNSEIGVISLESVIGETIHGARTLSYIGDIVNDAYDELDRTPARVHAWAKRLRDLSIARKLRSGLAEAFSRGDLGGELLARVMAAVDVVNRTGVTDSAAPLASGLDGLLGDKRTINKLDTGFSYLDLLCGLPLGGLITLAARPSMGKSSLARQIAVNVARAGNPVHVFSMEDTASVYLARHMSSITGINLQSILMGNLTDQERELMADKKAELDIPILVDDSANQTGKSVCLKARKHLRSHGTKLVIIDYLQYLSSEGFRSQIDAVNQSILDFASLAREANLAILLVGQLNRDCERRDDKRPIMSDLKDSGRIEEFSHTIWTLHREERYSGKRKGEAELHVMKNKNGPTCVVDLRFDASTVSFRQISQEDAT